MTQWLRWLLIATALVCVVFGLFRLAEWHVYVAIRDGTEPPAIAAMVDESVMRHGRLVALMNVVISGTIVLLVTWTHRASANIHALGGRGIRFSPSWAVGWYLVPIANLWMPYRVMTEIWRVSRDLIDTRSEPGSRLLRWWWFSWLAHLIVGNLHWLTPADVDGLEAIILSELLGIASLVLAIVSVGLALVLVERICVFQVHAADRLVSAVFA
jgi:hypothetical protein